MGVLLCLACLMLRSDAMILCVLYVPGDVFASYSSELEETSLFVFAWTFDWS